MPKVPFWSWMVKDSPQQGLHGISPRHSKTPKKWLLFLAVLLMSGEVFWKLRVP